MYEHPDAVTFFLIIKTRIFSNTYELFYSSSPKDSIQSFNLKFLRFERRARITASSIFQQKSRNIPKLSCVFRCDFSVIKSPGSSISEELSSTLSQFYLYVIAFDKTEILILIYHDHLFDSISMNRLR